MLAAHALCVALPLLFRPTRREPTPLLLHLAIASVRLLPLLHVLLTMGTSLDGLYRLALLTYLIEIDLARDADDEDAEAKERARVASPLCLLLLLLLVVAPRAPSPPLSTH